MMREKKVMFIGFYRPPFFSLFIYNQRRHAVCVNVKLNRFRPIDMFQSELWLLMFFFCSVQCIENERYMSTREKATHTTDWFSCISHSFVWLWSDQQQHISYSLLLYIFFFAFSFIHSKSSKYMCVRCFCFVLHNAAFFPFYLHINEENNDQNTNNKCSILEIFSILFLFRCWAELCYFECVCKMLFTLCKNRFWLNKCIVLFALSFRVCFFFFWSLSHTLIHSFTFSVAICFVVFFLIS